MRQLILSALAVVMLQLLASGAWAEGLIREIHVRGLESLEESAVVERLQSAVGEPMDRQAIQADQRTIINMGIFEPASLRVFSEDIPGGEDIILIFSLTENPEVSAIEITGNITMSTERIESIIPQRIGDRLRHQALREGRLGIVDHYQRQGHSDVRVQVDSASLPDGTVAIVVEIDEGMALVIEDLFIEGNEAFSDRRIRRQMVTRPGGLFGDNHFHDLLFEQDLMEVEAYHFDRGFLDVRVDQGDLNHEGTSISPTVIIREGPRYRFGEVHVTGNTLFTDLEITSRFDHLVGDWFDAKEMREALVEIKNLHGDEGHINAVVDPRLSPDSGRGAVDVLLTIREGPRVHVGSIYLQRATRSPTAQPETESANPIRRLAERLSPPVKAEVVRHVITLEEGDVYRNFEEVRSRDDLRRLRIFNQLELSRRPTSDPSVEDLYVTIDQDVTGFLGLGLGYGDESGIFGFARVIENNLNGEADVIRASVRVGTSVLDFNITHFNRFLGETDRSLKLSAYSWEYGRSEYDEQRLGGFAELGIPVTDYLTLALQGRSEYVDFALENPASPATTDAMGSYVLGLAQVSLKADHRTGDDWPTGGWVSSLNLEGGWADDWLVRLTGEWDQFMPITEDVILGVHLMGGVIPFDRGDIIFGERFFMGGSRDLRGFEFRGVGDVDSVNSDLFIGGATKVLAQTEVQFPIWRQLRGVVFADIGALGDGPFELDSPRASVGGGVRWVIPGFGSVAVDLASTVLDEDTDETEVLHINFLSDF